MLTDTNGQAIFSGVSAGSHNLKVTDTGFQDYNQTINVTADQTFPVSLVPGTTTSTNTEWILAIAAVVIIIVVIAVASK